MIISRTILLPLLVANLLFLSVGCTSSSSNAAPTSQDLDHALHVLAAGLPRKTDAATTLVEVKSDGRGGAIYVSSVDTSLVKFPSKEDLTHLLCDVGPDSPPEGNHNPFSGNTFIYRDLNGNELASIHFGRGECRGQGL
jgi:hypothetical protein